MLELVTGGSGSGKSAYAESRICEWNRQDPKPLFYIATMYPYGEETEKKIERHRMLRKGKGFETLEWYTGLKLHLEEGSLQGSDAVSYTHLRAHETDSYLVCRLLLEKKKKKEDKKKKKI